MNRTILYLMLVAGGLVWPVRALTVFGTVTAEGADAVTIPGAFITVTVFQQSDQGLYDVKLDQFQDSTDAAGAYQVALYTLLPLPAQTVRYVITAGHPQYHDCAFAVLGDISTATQADLRMWEVTANPSVVTGQAREATDAYCGTGFCIIPLPDTRLTLAPERGSAGHGANHAVLPTAVADRSGKFVIIVPSGLIGQPLLLTGEKTGYVTAASHAFLVPEPQKSTLEVDVYLAPAYPHCAVKSSAALKMAICTDQDSYNPGESVFMRYTVTNISNLTVKYDFTSGTQAVFTLSKNGVTVWTSSPASLPVLTTLTLGPGESAVYSGVFNAGELNCTDANCIMLGEYQVTAGLIGVEKTEVSAAVTFSEASWTAPRALTVGYLEAYRMVGAYYISFTPGGSGLPAYDIFDTTAPYDTLVGRLVKAFGPVFYRDCLGCPSVLDVESLEPVRKEQMLIRYDIQPIHPSLPTTHLTVYENGRVVYLYDTCPQCDNVKLPDADTVITLAALNGLLDLFNYNNYWNADSAYYDIQIAGAPLYTLFCNGRQVTAYGTFPAEIQNIITGLNDFISTLNSTRVNGPAAGSAVQPPRVALRSNPCMRSALFTVSVPEVQVLTLSVCDARGNLVAPVLDRVRYMPGTHTVVWDGRLLPPGIYFYSLISTGSVNNGKIIKTE